MKAISVMFVLVIDQTCSKVEVEIEAVYEDGETRSMRVPANRAVRLDLDALYRKENQDACAAE